MEGGGRIYAEVSAAAVRYPNFTAVQLNSYYNGQFAPLPSRLSRAQYKPAAHPYFRPRSYSTNAP